MNRIVLLLLLVILIKVPSFAQRDPPLVECFLPSISVTHAADQRLAIDLVFKKETGPVGHTEHQMYLLAYRSSDEAEIRKVASNPKWLDKRKPKEDDLFLEILFDRKLVSNVDSKVAKRSGFAGQDNLGKYSDGSTSGRTKESFLKLNTFAFSFSPTYAELFEAASKLAGFPAENEPSNPLGIYRQRIKLMVFVPVNDCRYSTKVRPEVRAKGDFGLNEYIGGTKPILYFRPLPYEFVFRRDGKVGTILYIR